MVALTYSVQPTIDVKSVAHIVKQGCDEIGKKGYNIYTGHGRVNFGRSLQLARDWKEPETKKKQPFQATSYALAAR